MSNSYVLGVEVNIIAIALIFTSWHVGEGIGLFLHI
ncbi:MAG: hypothetical protein UX89_C0016G0024 [Parcubacteria group bacterium GW2011_GWA2_47_16]|nr:MAG: hypothetical protein UX89_C0016G0024 [Parcubacteria group bacterium GW2011_GWA2_47_16]